MDVGSMAAAVLLSAAVAGSCVEVRHACRGSSDSATEVVLAEPGGYLATRLFFWHAGQTPANTVLARTSA